MAKPQGKLVQINRGKIHIRQMGCGEKTIVLLPGLGCPLPTIEFAPLMRKLSEKYTVCIIELFGYGFSDSTNTPRTNENYAEEIQETLKMAGLKPPYVLMPYSASGIYAEYYAAKYPNEIAGLILLDSSPTVKAIAQLWAYTEEEIEELTTALKQAEHSEYTSLDEEAINKIYTEFLTHGYTWEELEDIDEVPNHQDTLIAQDIALSGNIREVLTMQIPKHIPILVFSAGLVELDDDERVEYENYRKDHMTRLGDKAKLIVIEGSNHLNIAYHRDYLKIISSEIDKFLGREDS